MAALFACIPIIHLVFGLFFILAPEKFGHGSQQPPAFIGWFFVAFASVFILVGWTFAILVLIAGRFISRRKHYMCCFVMGCVECVFMPFGTALGVFTILVLNRQSVKELFNPRPSRVNQPQKLLFICSENRMRSLTAEKMSDVSVRILPGALC